jgi:hypothetical protein
MIGQREYVAQRNAAETFAFKAERHSQVFGLWRFIILFN